jgi:hypothetical protein
MRAFVVRPFGLKNGIDFDSVETALIAPALERLGISGSTTGEIAEQGDIREDVFRLVATADLVIADISAHNANVFYELGVRHALRERCTFLLRAKIDDVPFDLRGERYLEYDKDKPENAVDALVRALRETVDSLRSDSPVFRLLRLNQTLDSSDLARLIGCPDDFCAEVRRAAAEQRVGDLSLLAEEARRLPWAREGLRKVGVAQFDLKSFELARRTWEAVRQYDPGDVEANTLLATVYQKLKNLTLADEAVDRVLAREDVNGSLRAELEALRASNMKSRWLGEWQGMPEGVARQQAALRSAWLDKAYKGYSDAFACDRNHFYSGVNALAMGTLVLGLSESCADVWGGMHDSDDEARVAKKKLAESLQILTAGVRLACDSAGRAAAFKKKRNLWLEISRADLALLTVGAKPARVAQVYRDALAGAPRFTFSSVRRQLEIFRDLGIATEAASAALAVVDEGEGALRAEPGGISSPSRVVVFTGHRIDAPDRGVARFPSRAEPIARKLIADALDAEIAATGGEVVGMAGGASGGDILFHELCMERRIPTELFIVSGRDAFVRESVKDAGPQWISRFDRLYESLPTRALGESDEPLTLPRWLRGAERYSVWERNNRWILNNALAYGAQRVTLIALWDGKEGDGPGGTKDMVKTAEERGAKVVVLGAAVLGATEGERTP